MIVLGLTGSIGMGKTTTAEMFAAEGVPVWSADAAVHALYAPGGAAVAAVEAAFPGVVRDGGVDRHRLAAQLGHDEAAFARLEAIVHPLVAADRAEFLAGQRRRGAAVVVIDVPLLFESELEREADAVVVVTTSPDVQRRRVLQRPGMTGDRLDAILSRQVPDADKRARAHFVIDTSHGLEPARAEVRRILSAVRDPGFSPHAKLASPGERQH